MRITALETQITRIPFTMGAPTGAAGLGTATMDTLWLRVVTDAGLEGWGEGFGHAVTPATRVALDTLVAPAALGGDAGDIRGLHARLAQRLHLFGRNGPAVYALSALDIALWDIAGKAAGLPLHRMLGAATPKPTPAYASLLRYGEAGSLRDAVTRARSEGYAALKLHEIDPALIAVARDAAGPDMPMMVDVNCPWSVAEALAMAHAMRESAPAWLEEPVWPPEDHVGLARVRRECGLPIAAGENAHGLHDFAHLFAAGALDVAQPSVTKIGGITTMLAVAALAEAHAVRLVPHCAYFGAGYLASLHVHAALSPTAPFERLFVELEANPYHDLIAAPDGMVHVPSNPGLGRDPDPAVLERYRLGDVVTTRAA